MSGRVEALVAAGSRGSLAAIGAAALALCSCVTGPALRERSRAVADELVQARKQNAAQCAPREMAVAEANLKFAQLELDQGDSFRADDHLSLASKNARAALSQSKECGPVQVLIRERAPAMQAPPPPPPPRVALKDTDGDGVPDIDDLCPEVPGPASNHGCPIATDRDGDGVPDEIDRCPDVPGPKENFGCPWPDRDGDGIADKDDKCPDQPGPIENQGCPWPDRDHDGVPDKDDKCPDEPGPADNFGCPRKQSLVIVRRDRIELRQQIHFATNRSRILPDSYELLRQVAQALKDAPRVQVRIEGHTDNVGKPDSNLTLSQARADAVKEFLVRQGVPDTQLAAEGYGSTRPIASNLTRFGKAANRRVEFRLQDKSGDPAK